MLHLWDLGEPVQADGPPPATKTDAEREWLRFWVTEDRGLTEPERERYRSGLPPWSAYGRAKRRGESGPALNRSCRKVLQLRSAGLTFREIGERCGFGTARASQLHASAISRTMDYIDSTAYPRNHWW